MSILNYFFIGFAFTFFIDLLFSLDLIKNHPKMKDKVWGMKERILCIIIWPVSSITFIIAFIKTYFKR